MSDTSTLWGGTRCRYWNPDCASRHADPPGSTPFACHCPEPLAVRMQRERAERAEEQLNRTKNAMAALLELVGR